jgi:hypothetical protein
MGADQSARPLRRAEFDIPFVSLRPYGALQTGFSPECQLLKAPLIAGQPDHTQPNKSKNIPLFFAGYPVFSVPGSIT